METTEYLLLGDTWVTARDLKEDGDFLVGEVGLPAEDGMGFHDFSWVPAKIRKDKVIIHAG